MEKMLSCLLADGVIDECTSEYILIHYSSVRLAYWYLYDNGLLREEDKSHFERVIRRRCGRWSRVHVKALRYDIEIIGVYYTGTVFKVISVRNGDVDVEYLLDFIKGLGYE